MSALFSHFFDFFLICLWVRILVIQANACVGSPVRNVSASVCCSCVVMLSLYPHMSVLSHLYLGMVSLGLALLVESLEIDVLIVAETAVCDDAFRWCLSWMWIVSTRPGIVQRIKSICDEPFPLC